MRVLECPLSSAEQHRVHARIAKKGQQLLQKPRGELVEVHFRF